MKSDESGRVHAAVSRTAVLALTLAIAALPGCGRSSPERLLVATSWPAAERGRLETEFQNWIAASHDHLGHRRVRLEWLALAPGDDPLKWALRASPPQVFLAESSILQPLLSTGQLAPIEPAGSARWCTLPSPAAGAGIKRPRRSGQSPWSDPRGDRASLLWAMGQLSEGGWREGYARLIRTAAARERFRRSGVSVLRADSGDAIPPDRHRGGGQPGVPGPSLESVAIARKAPDQELARGFLRFLVETRGATPAADQNALVNGFSAQVSSLVADLLGATLVDAQDELWTAWRALEGRNDRERAVAWLTEPPPWPPASIAKYLGREGERAMALIETLATEVATEPPARAWLLRSWLAPGRPVDESLLSELAQAAEGRLCREPRFRAWLREEWTAWARQRYRRVARWAAAGKPPSR